MRVKGYKPTYQQARKWIDELEALREAASAKRYSTRDRRYRNLYEKAKVTYRYLIDKLEVIR